MSDLSAPPDELLPPAPRQPSTGLRLGVFLALVVLGGYTAQYILELRHGARWYDGSFVRADFQLPRGARVLRTENLRLPFALAQGSGSLRVRTSAVTLHDWHKVLRSLRVECGDDIAPGVTVRVEVTDYSFRTGDDDALGHLTLEAVETAADGDHVHHVEVRADGVYLDPGELSPRPARASRDSPP